ncbi:hypothetical protein Q5H93_08520 [Hymenobacter sp. ASUV-10]|uniref:DUF2339 domain-containing protein n=1 Tax=Hymenobacter aranciens TaxID=3063996 RepID=A0ABT9B9C7_9BACT|nr:hypothetical protein [Hymenobacter sp. ASUV-10]MDO7874772.1 hypothetical protein [Hymenobacter sp. ASUV-10]
MPVPTPVLPAPPVAAPVPQPVFTPAPVAVPAPVPAAPPTLAPRPVAAADSALAATPAPSPAPLVPPTPPIPPRPPRRPPPPPEPTGPIWWERAATLLLENWTGILGAVVLVTGVGFLGIYAALRVSAPVRFLLICAFAAGLLGVRFALRQKGFARQLNSWLLSSAAAIFLFACVAAVSIEGLRWVTAPWDYLLLLAGVGANLLLAWRASREEVATLHGVLSLVALAVLPPTVLTLGTAAAVTAFTIAITYRQLWKYQLLLSIASFFAFHLYWHQQLTDIPNTQRLLAMGLVGLVGVAAAVVQYRSVYAQRRFEPLLFTAHLLNWTCLGINLYMYSTGSIWKTIPLGLGALLTFWAGRQAKKLGIGWLFQTDTIIALILALATALSLQGWHATNSVILLFMLLEALLVALVMARQREALVYRVALSVAGLAGGGLLVLAALTAGSSLPPALYRQAFVLALSGWAGLAFARLTYQQPLLRADVKAGLGATSTAESARNLLAGFAGLAGLLQAGAGLLLTWVLFSWPDAPVLPLVGALLTLGGGALALAAWVRTSAHTPDWVRQQQLLLAQFFAVLAGLGLHELNLSWSVVLGILYAENVAVALLAARRREPLLSHITQAGALLTGGGLLLTAWAKVGNALPHELYRDALVLALTGWLSLAFLRLAYRQLSANGSPDAPTEISETDQGLLSGFAGLAALLQASTGLLLARVLFGWQQAPVILLLAALLVMGGVALGLAAWVRAEPRLPAWVRLLQLLLAQALALLTVFGLHELGLSWPVVLGLLYAENLVVVFIAARKQEMLLYRVALGGTVAAGLSLLLTAVSNADHSLLPTLYRDALVLALAGWAGILIGNVAHRQLLSPQLAEGPASEPADRDLLGSIAGLAGLLQGGAGLLLGQALFGRSGAPVALLLVALLGLGGIALGLAAWVHAQGLLPRWVRRQQLVLGQALVVLAGLGLHEAGLSWPGVLLVLYAENLLVALLLRGRDEDDLLHLQAYVVVVLAALLPVLVPYTSPGAFGAEVRAALLVGAALLTVGYQLRHQLLPKVDDDYAMLPLGGILRLPVLGLAVGWLLLSGGALVVDQAWAAWALVGLLGGLLYLRQRVAAPGVWAGLLLTAVGYLGLQWRYALWPPAGQLASAGAVLLYLLPTLAVPLVGARVSWWAPAQRFVRGPWLYLLGLHLVVALVAAVPAGHVAYLSLGFTGLAGAAFAAAQVWRRRLPNDSAVWRAGLPDRYLLHLSYGLLTASLLTHGYLLTLHEQFFGQPAEYRTAALLFATLAALALAAPPATYPVYNSWRRLHPWLPEAALLFGTATLGHHVRTPWLPLLWAGAALGLTFLAARLPGRLRRLAVYGHLYYWLAAGTASLACLRYLRPEQLLSPEWWGLTAAVALLFGYVALALQAKNTPATDLSPAWDRLARPPRRVLEAGLLYPAFLALTLLLVQSFDRSVLTVLLMLEVVAVFSTSLLLRRQDLRYLALAGMLGSLLRLVFFDLSRSGTITRAFVFIFMGLLLLGMNALYARFKARFTPQDLGADDVAPQGLPEPDVPVG